MSTGDIVTRQYASFRGVDFRGEEINLNRSPDSLNMWKNYRTTESIRTRPELTIEKLFETPVWGLFWYEIGTRTELLVHSGTTLYKIENGSYIVMYEGLAPSRSESFVYNYRHVCSDACAAAFVKFFDGRSHFSIDEKQIIAILKIRKPN